MVSLAFKIARRLLAIGLLFCFYTASAQVAYDKISSRIDSLDKIGLPKSALVEVEKLDSIALKNNNPAQHIKAVLYRISFQSDIDDDARVTAINQLKTDLDKATYPAKPVLQSLLATMYRLYYNVNRWQLSQRTRIEKPGPDFTQWDLQTINDEISRQFRLSLQDYQKEQETPVSVLDGVLEGDTASRYLRPTLYDLLLQRALNFFLSDESALTKPRQPFTLNDPRLFGDSRTFANLKITTSDTSSTYYQGIQYLQQATLFHLQKKQEDALADIDLQRLEFLHNRTVLFPADSLYLNALQKIEKEFPASAISADGLVLEGKYYLQVDSLTIAMDRFSKAVAKYPNSLGAKNAANYIKVIQQKDISAVTENVNPPGKPLLALLRYHNVQTARVTIYKIWATQYNILAALPDERYRMDPTILPPTDTVLKYLEKLKPYKVEDLQLPGSHDYKTHQTEFKIDPLQSGIYVLIIQDASESGQATLQLTSFKVTNLSYATMRTPDDKIEIAVTDRETGTPLPGVQVAVEENEQHVTDVNGICYTGLHNSSNYSIKLTTATDTLYQGHRNTRVISTDVSNPVDRTILFTDRQIYRPGQTLYFKGLQLRSLAGKNNVLSYVSVKLEVKDENGKSIAAMPEVTNEFGSFSGSCVIPQNILDGQLSISTGNGTIYVRVEEYKRPSFTVEFLPVNGSFKPNDSVTIKGTVRAYSGYGISQARVAYHITRQFQFTSFRHYNRPSDFRQTEIATDTIKTDPLGQFQLKFKATGQEGMQDQTADYRYSINADVTDGSGETRSASSSVTVGPDNAMVAATIPTRALASDSIGAAVRVNNLNGVLQSGSVRLEVYSVKQPDHLFKTRLWAKPDQHLLSRQQYNDLFPEYACQDEDDKVNWPVQKLVAELTANPDGKTPSVFDLSILKKQPTGTYKITISAKTVSGDTGSTTSFLYLVNGPGKPQDFSHFVTPLSQKLTEKPVEVFVGSGSANHILMEKFNDSKLISTTWLTVTGDKQQLVKIAKDTGVNKMTLQFLMVYQNRLYVKREDFTNKQEDKGLNIRFATFRNKLQPGEKEQWKLQVSGNGHEKEVAEMVADLYDASLDAVSGADYWPGSLAFLHRTISDYYTWDDVFTRQAMSQPLHTKSFNFQFTERGYEHLIRFSGETANKVFIRGVPRMMELRVADPGAKSLKGDKNADVTIDEPVGNSTSYDELYDSKLREDVVESKASAYVTRGDAKRIPLEASEQLLNDYGDQATQNITTRKNFAETAFFYPQLRTNENGEILIDFTIPEALTTWRFKALAHTRTLETGYIEAEVITQKELSITANAPRFLREGDTITISARLANLTAGALKGKVQLQLYNAINMQPVSLLVNAADVTQNFEVGAAANKPVSFKLFIPGGIDALTYRLTAESGKYTDGEENTLPVLSNRTLVTESMPMMVRAGQTRDFTFDKLVNQTGPTLKSKTLTLEYTQNPAWYAVQALPYMMEYPYECSEQVFNRYYANSLASDMVNKLPAIKQVFDQWKSSNSDELLSNLEKNQELKATLIEETPWLRDAENETQQKKQIALLFDLNKMSYELRTNLEKLQKMQLPGGSFPWFGGDSPDRYITQNILAGIGELYHLNIAGLDNTILKNIADQAMSYLDNELSDAANKEKQDGAYEKREISPLEIHAYYAQSYFTARPMSANAQQMLVNYLNLVEKQWVNKSVYQQAMIALTMQRNKRPEVTAAIIKSLLETARQSDDLGMYWAKNQLGYFWYESPVETQSLLIELFTEVGDHDKAVDEMKIWLLRNKQTSDWKTTKATAAACYALLLKGSDLLADTGRSLIKLDGKSLEELKPGLKADAGTGYIKTNWADDQIKPAFGKVEIKNNGKNISWGALHWQYLETLDKISFSATNIQLQRKYFIQKQGTTGPVLTAVDAGHQPKTGDLLKVVVTLKADRDFEYVQLKDMRPAGTEPVDALSAYKYQDGLAYYQVTKDVATNFFINYLNKGGYVFEYALRVTQPGNFSTGITSIQCMYAPEFNAHSEGGRMVVTP
jgi:uncharacterized protein YfaS (alpha-2-macroglobulin family)